MAVEAKLQQRLQQSLILTPQLQQSLKLLQMGQLEYSETLSQELLENPALEEGASGSEEAESFAAEEGAPDGELSAADLLHQALGGDEGAGPIFERERGSGSLSPQMELTAQVPEGLSSHLLMQLRTTDLSPEELHIAAHIVGNLNRDGYLESSLEEIAESAECGLEEVEPVLQSIQLLDPPGIGARDLRECLLVQLDQLGWRNSLAWRLVEKYLGLLETQKHEQIAKQEGVPVARLYEALSIIRGLEPRPGRPFLDEPPVFISPDVYVRKVGDEFVVTLNDSGLPRLRLSQQYRDLLQGAVSGEKQYLQERFRSASWLLKNIQLRQQTILKVAKSIVERQKEFFEHGVLSLRPLVLREIAEDVGLHESTVSRVTSNKYVHTPHGVFEMKFFFRAGLRATDGDMSSEAVKEKIRSLLDAENRERPLSDQEIADSLQGSGINIARRTVAKYREAMNILPSTQRKRMY